MTLPPPFKSLLLASAVVAAPLLAPGAAQAQPVSGLYLGVGAGANWIQDPQHVDVKGANGSVIDNAFKINHNTGWVGVVSLGWGFGNGVRAEIEGNYRENHINSIGGAPFAPVNGVGGFQRSYGGMANVFYDFDLANFGLGQSIFQPYIGAGIGAIWTDWHNLRGNTNGNVATLFSNDSQANFAYQGIVGVATPLTWLGVTGLTLTLEYRFLGVVNPGLNLDVRNNNNTLVNRVKVEPQNFNHAVMVGFRYAFYQPPPPPAAPAAVAPAAARTYLVFFDWDRADLTQRAREIIGEAAQNARGTNTTRIEVAGHADRSGTPQYNQRLSERRAEAVAGELVRRGISRQEITVSAYGESRPLVPTADGVREPQNRRVEIVLR